MKLQFISTCHYCNRVEAHAVGCPQLVEPEHRELAVQRYTQGYGDAVQGREFPGTKPLTYKLGAAVALGQHIHS